LGPPAAVAATRLAVRRCLVELAGADATGSESAKRRGPGGPVLAAVSGGSDSLALVAALAFEAPKLGLRAAAVTVDHRLQEGSAERAACVADRCRSLGLDPVECVGVDVAGDGGPEAAARSARYAALDAAADRLGAIAVLLGHTLDDQAETVLLRLARGSGARSLAAMAAVSGRYRRPLLALRRQSTRAACADLGLAAWEDPQNADPAYARARVRHDLLPAAEAVLGPGVAESLARSADLLRADADALDGWAARALADVSDPEGSLDCAALAALPGAVRRRVLRHAAIAAGVPGGALSAAHVAAMDALVTGWHGQGPAALPGGVVAQRQCGRLSCR
jgi:tRNA(Ile)-lysidine synthase